MQFALCYPLRDAWPKFDWVRQALANRGHEVSRCADLSDLRVANANADIVLLCNYNAGFPMAELARVAQEERKAKWVQWWFDFLPPTLGPVEDCPPANVKQRSQQIALARAADLQLCKQRQNIFDSLGVDWDYLDQGCPAGMPAMTHQEAPEFDVLLPGVFGVAERRQRADDVRALCNAGLRVAVCGHASGGGIPGVTFLPFTQPMQLPAIASRAACILDVGFRTDVDGYWSDRVWLAMGMGGVLVRRWSEGQPSTWPCKCYDTAEELVGIVKELAGKKARTRARIGAAARKFTLDAHTYEHRVAQLVAICRKRFPKSERPQSARRKSVRS